MNGRRSTALAWLLAPLTLAPILFYYSFQQLPAGVAAGVLDLSGGWEISEGLKGPQGQELAAASQWQPHPLPGPVLAVPGEVRWLRRSVELGDELAGQDLFLVFGDTRSSLVRVYVNGAYVGETGGRGALVKWDFTALEGFDVPRETLRSGANVLTLRLESSLSSYGGIRDGRFWLGPSSALKPFFLAASSSESLLKLGPPFVSLFLLVLLSALLVAEGRGGDPYRYVVTILCVLGSLFYQLSRTGVFLGDLLSFGARVLVTIISIDVILIAFTEFSEHYLLGRRTWFAKVNRVVGVGLILAAILESLRIRNPLGTPAVFRVFLLYSLLTVSYCAVLGFRAVFRNRHPLQIVVGMGGVAAAGCAVLDTLTDLGVLKLPRLFAISLNSISLTFAGVVVADFLGISSRHRKLSEELEETHGELEATHAELTTALAEAREASRLKGEFLANVSHELRTPLNSIINLPEGLLEEFERDRLARCSSCASEFALEPGEVLEASAACPECAGRGTLEGTERLRFVGDAGRAARLLRSIQRKGEYLLGVVSQVLDFSKVTAGKMSLQNERLDAETLLREVIAEATPAAAERKVELRLAAAGPVQLSADPDKLKQVLLNLVGNAIKFSPENSAVELSVAEVDHEVVFSVTDHGIGIAPENHQVIFESFRQLDASHTRRYEGTGLGLALSRSLMALHGGDISVTSALGKGSTFRVRLPKTEARAGAASAPASGATPVVMVVDDDPVVAETLRLTFRHEPYRIESVTDARHALEAARQHRPSVIVLDLMMPRVGGLSLLKELKAQPDLRSIPVIVVSGYHSNRELVEAAGARWLGKPWKRAEFEALLRQLLPPAPDSVAEAGAPASTSQPIEALGSSRSGARAEVG